MWLWFRDARFVAASKFCTTDHFEAASTDALSTENRIIEEVRYKKKLPGSVDLWVMDKRYKEHLIGLFVN